MRDLEPRVDRDLTIKYEVLCASTLRVHFVGTAENDQAEFIQGALENAATIAGERRQDTAILDFCRLRFCYSECVRVVLNWMTTAFNRPDKLVVYYGREAWQRTSLIAMARFTPNCTLVDCSECNHDRTTETEKHFFAPTGSGQIVTIITCSDCNVEVARATEYFD